MQMSTLHILNKICKYLKKRFKISKIARLTKMMRHMHGPKIQKCWKNFMKPKIQSINLHNFAHWIELATTFTLNMTSKTQQSCKISQFVRLSKNVLHVKNVSLLPTLLNELSGTSSLVQPMRGTSNSLQTKFHPIWIGGCGAMSKTPTKSYN